MPISIWRGRILSAQPTGLTVRLTHNALPECDADAIDASCHFLGYKLAMPLMIGAMTGGTERADRINLHLAEAAAEAGVALAIGSQRAALETKRGKSRLREIAAGIPLIGNLGGVQLAREGGIDLAQRAVDAVEADALAIHLNPLQEITQPEGDRDWRGVEAAISTLVDSPPCPVIVGKSVPGSGDAPHACWRRGFMRLTVPDWAALTGHASKPCGGMITPPRMRLSSTGAFPPLMPFLPCVMLIRRCG